MLIRRLSDCDEIIAGDNSRLHELLHPDREYKFHGDYSLARAILPAGASSKRHILKSSEVYYILSGRGEIHVDNESSAVLTGDLVEIPPGAVQWLKNDGDDNLVFLCIVSPPWRSEDETIL